MPATNKRTAIPDYDRRAVQRYLHEPFWRRKFFIIYVRPQAHLFIVRKNNSTHDIHQKKGRRIIGLQIYGTRDRPVAPDKVPPRLRRQNLCVCPVGMTNCERDWPEGPISSSALCITL